MFAFFACITERWNVMAREQDKRGITDHQLALHELNITFPPTVTKEILFICIFFF